MLFKAVTISDKWAPIGRITTTCHADNAAGRISPEFTVGYQRVLPCILPHTILQHFMGPVCPGIARSLKSLQSDWSRLACGAYLLQSQRQNIKRPEQAASAVYTFTEEYSSFGKKGWYLYKYQGRSARGDAFSQDGSYFTG